jgi:hypothetical protein
MAYETGGRENILHLTHRSRLDAIAPNLLEFNQSLLVSQYLNKSITNPDLKFQANANK